MGRTFNKSHMNNNSQQKQSLKCKQKNSRLNCNINVIYVEKNLKSDANLKYTKLNVLQF